MSSQGLFNHLLTLLKRYFLSKIERILLKKDTIKFSKWFFKWLTTKPKGKYQTIAHSWNKAIATGYGMILTFTAMVTGNMGITIILVWSLIIFIFGLWLLSRGK